MTYLNIFVIITGALISLSLPVAAVLDTNVAICPSTTCSSTQCPNPSPPSPYSAGYIPVTKNGLCAQPPGNFTTDGCDDVCVLTTCCSDWGTPTSNTKELPNGVVIDCSSVNCGNVCRMACERETLGLEACDSTCTDVTGQGIAGEAYVFGRPGVCGVAGLAGLFSTGFSSVVNPTCPTHVGFGFRVSQDAYLFGSVENRLGWPLPGILAGLYVPANADNGYWMTTGTFDQMIETFRNPCDSCFHGALLVPGYTEYRFATVQNPSICTATRLAEKLYTLGYEAVTNNCLNAVFNVLSAYGVQFGPLLNPLAHPCPGGWFNALPSSDWGDAVIQPLVGGPVKAVTCSSTVPTSCGI